MERFSKVLVLDNEVEAQLLDALLNEKAIPHLMRSYHDSAFDVNTQCRFTNFFWNFVPSSFSSEIATVSLVDISKISSQRWFGCTRIFFCVLVLR